MIQLTISVFQSELMQQNNISFETKTARRGTQNIWLSNGLKHIHHHNELCNQTQNFAYWGFNNKYRLPMLLAMNLNNYCLLQPKFVLSDDNIEKKFLILI